jgi:predicted HTH transcriptional regulator
LASGKSANKNFANDIAAFSLDGGVILIGIDEDSMPPSLHPVDLAGLAERVEQIAATAVDEGVVVITTEIHAADKPGHGYLVVQIPVSPRAPHMADDKYYGRGDKTNRVLSHAEVFLLHERRVAEQRDIG